MSAAIAARLVRHRAANAGLSRLMARFTTIRKMSGGPDWIKSERERLGIRAKAVTKILSEEESWSKSDPTRDSFSMVAPSRADKVVLVASGRYKPGQVPYLVEFGEVEGYVFF